MNISRSLRSLSKQRASDLLNFNKAAASNVQFTSSAFTSGNNSLHVSTAAVSVTGQCSFSTFGTSVQGMCNTATIVTDPLEKHIPSRVVSSGLGSVFEPRSVAVIGATDRAGSVGRTIVNNLIIGNKKGGNRYEIYPIYPTRKTVLDLPCFSKLSDIPADVDMAVIVTPAKTCLSVMKECAAKGVKAAVVISAGFKEVGPEGIALENELVRVAREAGIRIIGPNCIGVMNPNFGLNATFAATIGLPGNVAFISQSGAMCTAVLDWSLMENVGFSAFISVGSMADVHWGDMIDYLGSDPNTSSILIYMESIGNAAAFLSAAREASLTKPIVVIKAGKSEQAAKAAASHTGSLAGSYASFEAAMRRVGVLTVDTIQDLFNCALVLAKQPRPNGPNLMIVTNAGGPAVLATDAAVESGAVIADIEQGTRDRLNKILPASWSHHNPVDILGDATPSLYATSLQVCLEDNNADGVLVILSPQDVTDPTGTAKELIKAVESMKAKPSYKSKPILASWMGGEAVAEGLHLLNQAGIPTFSNPDEAAATFGKLWKQVEALNTLYGKQEVPSSSSSTSVDISLISKKDRQTCIDLMTRVASEGRSLLTEAESKQVLSAYGIPVVETIIATTAGEAEAAAKKINVPLYAVKLDSKTLTHKADVGGVKLNLNRDQVVKAFEEIRDSVIALHGAEHFQGVTVQPMIRLDKGLELILGSTVDSQFGPLVMFGTGGTMVEVFKDTALAVPPLNSNLADSLMKQTKIYKALKGGHGKRFEGVDLVKLSEILSRFSAMVVDLSNHVSECDINPLLAMKADDGFVALDARFALKKPSAEAPQLSVRPYPLNYVSYSTLENGQSVTIRPSCPADDESLQRFHESLSQETVGLCYGDAMPLQKRVSKNNMIKTCFADYDRLLTLVAIKEPREMVGMVLLERPPPNHLHRETASVRLIVADKYQGQGLDETLMNNIVQIAKAEGVTTLKAPLLSENVEFLKLAKKLGWECKETETRDVKMCFLSL